MQVEDIVPQAGLDSACFLVHAAAQAPETVVLGALQGMTHCLGLHRFNPWSLNPVPGKDLSALPDELVFLLWQDEAGRYGVLIPLADGGVRHSLGGCAQGIALHRMLWEKPQAGCRAAFTATGHDPFELVEASVSLLAEKLRTFRPRWDKPLPRWVDLLGWCTWDAFYREVTQAGVIEGLEQAKITSVPFGFMILDDGWQDTDDRQMISFGANKEKFPEGLEHLINVAKHDYGIRMFGIWHAFQGYWYGIKPGSPAAADYRLIHTSQRAHNRPEDEPADRDLLCPEDIARFYYDFHRTLRAAGVVMIKVDNQGSMDHFLNETTVAPTPTMVRYQEAMQGAAQFFFHGETLHCLSQGTDILFNLEAANVMRNSEDYYPTRPLHQGKHIYANALNNVFMQAFCLPDWDMFHSGSPLGEFHAAARAISGGPVYVSDKPGNWNAALIHKLVTSDGSVLRCPQPALPTQDCLFTDAYAAPHLLKIQNRNPHAGVLGVFNCCQAEDVTDPITGQFAVSDIRGLGGDAFALYYHNAGTAQLTQFAASHSISLPALACEIITAVPLVNGTAVFGLIDKFNGSAAILAQQWIAPDCLEVTLREGGRCGIVSHAPIRATSVNGTAVPCSPQPDSLWIADLPVQPNITLRIHITPQG